MTKQNDWLKNRTYSSADFKDIKKLVKLKEKKGLKISICFPTLNEEKTIGNSIVIMKSELMDRYPLVDEIAVVDSGSTDNTLAIAKKFGASIYTASDHLKSEGEVKGKGENLWKALYLLKGDIIVYIDSDISNIHHRFAYGLIGPLLYDDKIKFVKAFYRRPLQESLKLKNTGGGRVTEILIRPLFSQFFPELTGIIQPLSGEYAGYRDVLDKIPFPIGYGVETGMLIDIYQKWGLEVMAQTNLNIRIHRNQEVSSLQKMSFGVMQTFWKRLNQYKDITNLSPESLILRYIERKDDIHNMIETKIEELERKPMIDVEEYRKTYNA
jgi:glucosyl-3-phosphoglycerate synthase